MESTMTTSYPVVQVSYTGGCFCDRPDLPTDGPEFEWGRNRRRDFRRKVSELAASLGAGPVEFHPKEMVAWASIPHKCQHRDTQCIRFDWGIKFRKIA